MISCSGRTEQICAQEKGWMPRPPTMRVCAGCSCSLQDRERRASLDSRNLWKRVGAQVLMIEAGAGKEGTMGKIEWLVGAQVQPQYRTPQINCIFVRSTPYFKFPQVWARTRYYALHTAHDTSAASPATIDVHRPAKLLSANAWGHLPRLCDRRLMGWIHARCGVSNARHWVKCGRLMTGRG